MGDDAAADEVITQKEHERVGADILLRDVYAVRDAERQWLQDIGNARAKLRPVADGLPDLVAGFRRDDDPDLFDARLDEVLDGVEQHRLVGHRHELLRAGIGQRPQARAFAAGEDQTFHCSAP